MRADELPSIVVSGASGILGRHFLEAARDHYRIFALARRSQGEARVPPHDNIEWIQVDIAEWSMLKGVMQWIKDSGGADFVLHLAAFYDFSNADSPEYMRTNVKGTRHMLEQAKFLCVKRFLFASSVAACSVPRPGTAITENSPADADFPYARSKRQGETMVREYSAWFPCTILRLSAVFSDWCEYPPLYVFLSTWLSRRWNARVLAGRGASAVSYIHVHDVNRMILRVLRMTHELPDLGVYLVSSDGSTSHLQLHEAATRYCFGRAVTPRLLPKLIVAPGLVARDLAGRLRGRRPFERPWMLRYIDTQLEVDSSATRRALGWAASPRLHILRRLLFLVEKMKSDLFEWERSNEVILRRVVDRPSLRIHEALAGCRDELVAAVVDAIRSPSQSSRFGRYQEMDPVELQWSVNILCRLLLAAIRTRERTPLLDYAHDLACRRKKQGFGVHEVREVLLEVESVARRACHERLDLEGLEGEVYDSVALPLQLATDEVEGCFERLDSDVGSAESTALPARVPGRHLRDFELLLSQLEAFQVRPPEARSTPGDLDREGPPSPRNGTLEGQS